LKLEASTDYQSGRGLSTIGCTLWPARL
jgi:hypothetical protein